MLDNLLEEFYMKLTMSFYKTASRNQALDIENLSTVEMSCLEIVYYLKNPTYSELAEFLNISQPNATYRINKLIKKGFLRKTNDDNDKRIYRLQVTDKFMDYYCLNDTYIENILTQLKNQCTPQELEQFKKTLKILTKEIMD